MTLFTAEHDQFRASVRRFVDERINPNIDEWEAAGMMPLHDIIKEMAGLGFVGLDYDPAYGGQGADHVFTLVLAEEMGRVNNGSFPMAFGVHNAMATPSLHKYGTHELKEQFLTPAMHGEVVAAVAITEPDAGSDVAGLKTKAVRDGDDWIINGSKIYITNALQADWICMLARTSDEGGFKGMSQIIVPTDTPGFSVAKKLDKLGMRASDTGLLSFDDVRVPVSNTIGTIGRGFQQQMEQFVMERMWGCYSTPPAIELALGRTREYAKQRKVFGQPLSSQQYLAYTYAELAAEADLLKVYNHAIAQAVLDGANTTRMATVAKLKAGRLARQVADWCMQVHGGVGYMEETWTARFLRDNRLLSIGGGADEVMLRVLSSMDGFA
ncbi:MAG: acyl-CoA dehydrogenase [Mycolicibacterium sp.]|uniref:acyl-CoA dehydrogenase family protein n=1 Tax=Mycolicibacterium sp. TaxID=2320850 RepID=UPI000F941F7D|nr:acyl-CoA dehydrogenase family protein [Mycolicibacterium sp.]RUP30078.1 MAG: acyl-CoA dehydrogenase [Mycolicibacterium sp.]